MANRPSEQLRIFPLEDITFRVARNQAGDQVLMTWKNLLKDEQRVISLLYQKNFAAAIALMTGLGEKKYRPLVVNAFLLALEEKMGVPYFSGTLDTKKSNFGPLAEDALLL